MLVFMPSRGSALALRLQAKLRNLARQIWGRLTRTDESGYFSHPVNTMTDAFAESHRATALMMAAILVIAAAIFDLVAGALSKDPLLFIAGVLFSCSGVLLFDLWKQNPR
jgi:hypothetical protein